MDSNLYEILYGNENELLDFSFMDIGKIYRSQVGMKTSKRIYNQKNIPEMPRSNKHSIAKARYGRKL